MAETPETNPGPNICPAPAIDPTLVPKYPVYQLHYKEQADPEQPHPEQAVAGQVRDVVLELDGIRVEPALGQSPAEAAVAAISRKATEQDREAVRVVVTTGASDTNQDTNQTGGPNQAGGKWLNIVTRDGDVIEVPDRAGPHPGQSNSGQAQGKAPRKTPGPGKPLVVGGAAVLALAVVSTGATIAITAATDQTPEPEPVEAWQVPNAGAQVPVGLPSGYATTADWAISVEDQNAPVAIEADTLESATLEDDMLAFIDAEGQLSIVEAETAQPVWHSTQAPRDLEELQVSTWAGHEVLIEATNRQLRIWPIPQEPTEEPVTPSVVELSHQAEVSFAGDAPLIYLDDYVTLSDAGDGTLTEVEIPAGTEPLLVSETDVVSIDAAHIYRTPIHSNEGAANESDDEDTASHSSGDPVSESVELSHHSAAQGPRAENVWTLTEKAVVGIYEGADEQSLLQVFDLTTGDRISAKHLENPPQDSDDALVDEQAQTAVIGGTALHWGVQQDEVDPVSELSQSLQDPLLHGTTLWGATHQGPAQIDISSPDAEAEHYETFREEDPAPVLVTDDAAYVAAPRGDDTLLYRVNYDQTGQSGEATPNEIEDEG